MIDFLLAPDVIIFSLAAGVFFLLALLEIGAMALGAAGSMFHVDADLDLDVDVDLDIHGLAHPLEWLGVGRVPLAILLNTFLFLFGFSGLLAQTMADSGFSAPLPWWLAVPAALGVSLLGTRVIGRALARIMPRDTSFASSRHEVLGHEVVITIGTARAGHPAEAKWVDRFGATKYLMVEPAHPDQEITAGTRAIVVEMCDRTAKVEPTPTLPAPSQT